MYVQKYIQRKTLKRSHLINSLLAEWNIQPEHRDAINEPFAEIGFFCCWCFFVRFFGHYFVYSDRFRALCIISCSRFPYYLTLIETPLLSLSTQRSNLAHNQSLHVDWIKRTNVHTDHRAHVCVDKNHTSDRTPKIALHFWIGVI